MAKIIKSTTNKEELARFSAGLDAYSKECAVIDFMTQPSDYTDPDYPPPDFEDEILFSSPRAKVFAKLQTLIACDLYQTAPDVFAYLREVGKRNTKIEPATVLDGILMLERRLPPAPDTLHPSEGRRASVRSDWLGSAIALIIAGHPDAIEDISVLDLVAVYQGNIQKSNSRRPPHTDIKEDFIINIGNRVSHGSLIRNEGTIDIPLNEIMALVATNNIDFVKLLKEPNFYNKFYKILYPLVVENPAGNYLFHDALKKIETVITAQKSLEELIPEEQALQCFFKCAEELEAKKKPNNVMQGQAWILDNKRAMHSTTGFLVEDTIDDDRWLTRIGLTLKPRKIVADLGELNWEKLAPTLDRTAIMKEAAEVAKASRIGRDGIN